MIDYSPYGPPEINGHPEQGLDLTFQFTARDFHALGRRYCKNNVFLRVLLFQRPHQRERRDDFTDRQGMDPYTLLLG
jgi:hypothetical protein